MGLMTVIKTQAALHWLHQNKMSLSIIKSNKLLIKSKTIITIMIINKISNNLKIDK